jgi:phosphatidylinositol alpha 1,6-mannosyltransferase
MRKTLFKETVNKLSWRHFVALGDSLPVGVGDPVEGIPHVGWADQVAAIFREENPDLLFTNLGEAGCRACAVRAVQLPKALELCPDLVSIQVGSNDAVDRAWSPQDYYETLSSIVKPLSSQEAKILMLTSHNPAGLPRKMGVIGRRFKEMVEIMRIVSKEYDAIFVDLTSSKAGSHLDHWSADRWHPNARGYREACDVVLSSLKARVLQ